MTFQYHRYQWLLALPEDDTLDLKDRLPALSGSSLMKNAVYTFDGNKLMISGIKRIIDVFK